MEDPKHHNGRPIAVDSIAESSSKDLPAFLAKPKGMPAYHGFPILEETALEGFRLGLITDFGSDFTEGDAFVVAPDGSRAGLVWQISDAVSVSELSPLTADRWGVWAVTFVLPMSDVENARKNF